MSYFTFAVLETVSSLVTLLAITHWGQAADRVGNRKMLVLASFLVPFVPLLWMLSTNVYYLGLAQAAQQAAERDRGRNKEGFRHSSQFPA